MEILIDDRHSLHKYEVVPAILEEVLEEGFECESFCRSLSNFLKRNKISQFVIVWLERSPGQYTRAFSFKEEPALEGTLRIKIIFFERECETILEAL